MQVYSCPKCRCEVRRYDCGPGQIWDEKGLTNEQMDIWLDSPNFTRGKETKKWLSCVELNEKTMTVIKIELINPNARMLIEDLAKLNLIKIQEVETPQARFSALLARLRSADTETPSLEDIAKEVDMVREQRTNG